MYKFYPFDYKKFLIVRGNKAVMKTEGYPIPEIPPEMMSPTMKYIMEGHYNGYVALRKWRIPYQWWSNPNAEGLSYLSIHGGITYCHTQSSNELFAVLLEFFLTVSHKLQKVVAGIFRKFEVEDTIKKDKNGFPNMPVFMKVDIFFRNYINPFIEILFGDLVVFGFDCAHAGDEDNPKLRDHLIVMLLTEQMERQLLEFAKVYPKWLKASREDRVIMMDKVRTGEKFKEELGFGAMLDILSGGKEFGKIGKKAEVKQLKRMWNAKKVDKTSKVNEESNERKE